MKNQDIDTFSYLYHNIIEEYFSQVCTNFSEYQVRSSIDGTSISLAIRNKFSEYRVKTSGNIISNRLDRHKLASCICGAIECIQPLVVKRGMHSNFMANEFIALQSGLTVIKSFMTEEYLQKCELAPSQKEAAYSYIMKNFTMKTPELSENICDIQEYDLNICNALLWSNEHCSHINKTCFQYDVWAYATIFYHLENYNKPRFIEMCNIYIKENFL